MAASNSCTLQLHSHPLKNLFWSQHSPLSSQQAQLCPPPFACRALSGLSRRHLQVRQGLSAGKRVALSEESRRFPVPWQPTLKNRGLRRTFLCRAEEEGKSSEGAPVETKVENKEEHDTATRSEDGSTKEDGAAKQPEDQPPGKVPDFIPLPLPKAIIEVLKTQVFGFDTFFVTGQEAFPEGGVLFKGNLRGDAAKACTKIRKRLSDKFGDEYEFFLLRSPEDDNPAAVVIPKAAISPRQPPVPELLSASIFAFSTIATIFIRNGVIFEEGLPLDQMGTPILKAILDTWPSSLVLLGVLGAHELGHQVAAKRHNVKLGVPFFIPGLQLGTFGAITQIKSILPTRSVLIEIAAAGPALGAVVGLGLLLAGLILPPVDGVGTVVDASVFHDSFLAGGIAKLLLGDALQEGKPIAVNPVALAAWSALTVNALQLIPVGELDGGRLALGIFGRKVWGSFSLVSYLILGVAGIFNDLALYLVVLTAFLQRGPVPPHSDEISEPDTTRKALGIAALAFGLLVLLPFPIPFSDNGQQLLDSGNSLML